MPKKCNDMFFHFQLHAHVIAERPIVRQARFKTIQSMHPGWVYEHGVCQSGRAMHWDQEKERDPNNPVIQ